MNSHIAILIIFFNKLAQTIECIESFLPSGQNIYVLNNASEEGSWKLLQQKYGGHKNVFFFHSPVNIGPARGRNLLIEKSTEEWLFMADNDTRIRPAEWKAVFDKKVTEHGKGVLIYCPKIFNVHEHSYAVPQHFVEKNGVVRIEDSVTEITNYFSCCGVIMHRNLFEDYGLFDPALFAFEDFEFSIRALRSAKGALKVHPLQQVELIHDHQLQQKKVDKKAVLERYNEVRIKESMQRVVDKHHIIFDHDWQWWTRKQVADMTGKTLLQKIKQRIARRIGR